MAINKFAFKAHRFLEGYLSFILIAGCHLNSLVRSRLWSLLGFFALLTFSLQNICKKNLGEIYGGVKEIFKALTLGLLEMIVKRGGFLGREGKILAIEQL